MIICNLLESCTDTEHKCLVKRTTNNLHTNWQPLCIKAARYTHARQTSQTG